MVKFHPEKYWLRGAIFVWLVMLCMIATGGSLQATASPSIDVREYPSYMEEVESVTLAPVQNATSSKGIEITIQSELLNRFEANRRLNVVNSGPPIIERKAGELNGSEEEMLEQERHLVAESASSTGQSRLILFTTLSDIRTEIIEDTYACGRHGNSTCVSSRTFGASATISVRLVDVETGKTVLNEKFKEYWYEPKDADLTPSARQEKALNATIEKLTNTLLFPVKRFELIDDCLRTAATPPRNASMPIFVKKFVARQKLFAILYLPKEAVSHDFILDIVVKGHETPIVSQKFRWESPQDSIMGYEFSLEEVAARRPGFSNYTVRLLQPLPNGDKKLVLTRDFSIVAVGTRTD